MLTAALVFGALWAVASAAVAPRSPCPQFFQYFEKNTGEIYGAVNVPNDRSGVYDLELNMSIALETGNNINIVRITPDYNVQQGEKLLYHVFFPSRFIIPKVTSLRFNGQIYCAGPTEQAPVITNLSKRDILRTGINADTKPQNSYQTQSPYQTRPPSIQVYPTNPPQIYQDDEPSSPQPQPTRPKPPRLPIPIPTSSKPMRPLVQVQININDAQSGNDECGINVDFQPLVIAGTPTRVGEYPWLVPMFYLDKGNYNFRCAGTLISNRHVLTAAHCVRNPDGSDVTKENILMVLGKHNIKNWAIKSTIRGIGELVIHPDYRTPGDADIALIILDSPVTFGDGIRPICLWDESDELDDFVGTNGVVAGWGKDETGRDFVPEPRQVTMPIVSQEKCLRSDDRFLKLTSGRTFCAGERKGAAPCTGDSGGGFVMKRAGRWKLRGIVSVALADPRTRSCDPKNYVVFSDVPKYRSWLINALQI